jgi:hypothetical protein
MTTPAFGTAGFNEFDSIGCDYCAQDEQITLDLNKCTPGWSAARPLIKRFFERANDQFERQGLSPRSPFTAALAYVRERRA